MNRKYPFKLFLLGVAMNFLFHFFYLFIPGVVSCIIGIWNKTALSIGLAMLCLDLILSVVEQIRIRNAALSDSDNPEFNELMDAFYGTNSEESFEEVLARKQQEAEEQQQDQAILEKLVVYRTLRDTIKKDMPLEQMICAFEKMCDISVGDPDDLLFETGTYTFSGRKLFIFNLVRQFQFLDEHEYVQLRLELTYEPSAKTFGLPKIHWGDPTDGEFFDVVRNSRQYRAVKDVPMVSAEVRVERT